MRIPHISRLQKLTLIEKLLFGFGVLFLVWSRFWLLASVPATLTHDETVYAIQSKSFVEQGTTLNQELSFFTLQPSHIMYAEWPAQVMALGFLFSDNPLFATHFSSAVMGLLFPFLVSILVYGIWKRSDVAKATWFVIVFSPLFWQMSRLSYDAFFSIFFYIAAGALFVQKRPALVLASLPFFAIGFFQYQGFKLLLTPWIGLLCMLMLVERTKKWQISAIITFFREHPYHLLVLGVSMGIMAYYGLILLPQQNVSTRLSSFIFSDDTYLEEIVNTERRLSLENPFMSLVSNKFTATFVFILQRLVGVFNLKTLLLLIEPNVSGFSVWTHGVFYWLELALSGIGMAWLLMTRKTRISGLLLLASILTFCLPALVNIGSEWYLLRSMFSYFLLLVAAGWGLAYLTRNRKVAFLVAIAYLLSILNFAYQYWYRYPVISLDWGNFDERVLARYLDLYQDNHPTTQILVYGVEPEFDYWSFLLYSNKFNKETADSIAEQSRRFTPFLSEAEYQIGNITFSSFCAPADPHAVVTTATLPHVVIIRKDHKRCSEQDPVKIAMEASAIRPAKTVLSVPAVLDSGQRIAIYGDELCQEYARTFVHLKDLDQTMLENKNTETLCSQWITNLDW